MGRTSPNIVIKTSATTAEYPLPEGYTMLEYIEQPLTGSAYIKTGVSGGNSLDFVLDAVTYDNVGNATGTFGSIFGGRYNTTYEYQISTYTNAASRKGSLRVGTTAYNANIVQNERFQATLSGTSYTCNGSTISVTRNIGNNGREIYIFALNANGTVQEYGHGRIYSFKLYSSSTLVRDYVPAKNSNGVVGLYDKVNDVFATSANSDTFTAGPSIPNGLEVPITEDCRRVYNLMKDDYVLLKWNDSDPHPMSVGDSIDDELFGKFFITEPQEPDYDYDSGAYRHEMRFDREYIGWKNVIHMLTYSVTEGGTTTRVRRETEWSLTDTLPHHLDEIVRNLQVLGYNYVYFDQQLADQGIDTTTAICVSFSGTSIYDALNALAQAWECEWWVEYNNDYSEGTINFGKCSNLTEYDIEYGENAERIVPSRSESEYANKIYAYGSTRNIPDTYRKSLIFTVTGSQTEDSVTMYQDSGRVIRKDMLHISDDNEFNFKLDFDEPVITETGGADSYPYMATCTETFTVAQKVRYSITGGISLAVSVSLLGEGSAHADVKGYVKLDNDYIIEEQYLSPDFDDPATNYYNILPNQGGMEKVLDSGQHTFEVKFWLVNSVSEAKLIISDATLTAKTLTFNTLGYSVSCPLVYSGDSYTVQFNPLVKEYSVSDFNWFSFVGSTPSGFGTGKDYTLSFSDGSTNGLRRTKVPTSYYTDDSGEQGLRLVGEKRLMLPESTGGYVIPDGADTSTNKVVEKVVIFDEIFPECTLQVTSVQVGSYTANTEYSDGSKTYGTLPRYTISCRRVSNGSLVDFDFNSDYLTTNPLQVKFLTKDEGTDRGASSSRSGQHLLAGMTFGVNFTQASQTYTIEWNEDYGAKLPNGTLKPEVGDAFVLLGWNVAAMSSLGLISSAETRLKDNADAYIEAISTPQLTFACTMMSDRMMSGGLIDMGRNVKIIRGNLQQSTRVIGYEYKLDIPEDSPIYTCGETEPYSRLRALEKALNAKTQSVSASSGTASVPTGNTGGGGGSEGGGSLTGVLSWLSGAASSFVPGSFNGSENKSIIIPTDINQLVNSNKLLRINADISPSPITGMRVVTLVDSEGNPIVPQIPVAAISGSISSLMTLEGLSDTQISASPSNKFLKYSGTKWVDSDIDLEDIYDIQYTGNFPSDGDVLQYVQSGGGGYWTNQQVATTLAGLTDTNISAYPSSKFLYHNGTNWVDTFLYLGDIRDVVFEGDAEEGDFLGFDGEYWTNLKIGLGDLSNVSTTGATSGQALIYNGTSWAPGTVASTLAGLTDTQISASPSTKILKHNGTKWADSWLYLDDLQNVDFHDQPTTGNVLTYNGTDWVAGNVASSLSGLSDTTITSPSSGQFLRYSNGSWTNMTVRLENLYDVDTTDIEGGYILVYRGTGWVAEDNSLGNLTNVNVSSATDGQALVYDEDNDIWIPGTVGGGGGSSYTAGTGIDITSSVISLKSAKYNEIGGVKVRRIVNDSKVSGSTVGRSAFVADMSYPTYYTDVLTTSDCLPIQMDAAGYLFVDMSVFSGGGSGSGSTTIRNYSSSNCTIDLKDTSYSGYSSRSFKVLTDVVISNPSDGDVLKYEGGYWVNGSGGGSYTLPIASSSRLGGIKVGSGLSINSSTGVLSVTGGGGSFDPSAATDIIPDGDSLYDLGSSSSYWNNIYVNEVHFQDSDGHTGRLVFSEGNFILYGGPLWIADGNVYPNQEP